MPSWSGISTCEALLGVSLAHLAPLSPATYLLEGTQQQMATTRSLLGHVWPLLAIGIAVIPVGVFIFAQAERYAKRTGRLKRSG